VIDEKCTFPKAEPVTNRPPHGTKIDSSDEYKNASDPIFVDRQSDSNEIDGSDSQDEKHDKQALPTLDRIKID
jgi:hypothetical protein